MATHLQLARQVAMGVCMELRCMRKREKHIAVCVAGSGSVAVRHLTRASRSTAHSKCPDGRPLLCSQQQLCDGCLLLYSNE